MNGRKLMIEEISFDEFEERAEMPKLTKSPVNQIQLVKYAGASGDFHPLHTDPEFGKKIGIGQIAHGMLIMGFAGEALTNWIPKKYIRQFSVRFVGMTRLGDSVTVTGKIGRKEITGKQCVLWGEIIAKNQKDEVLLIGTFKAEVYV